MIGLTDTKPKKICDHLNTLFDGKQQKNEDLNEVRDRCSKFKQEIRDLNEKLNNCVSKDDIDELITDIRESFELFMNSTPREKDNEVDIKISELGKRFDDLNNKFIELGLHNVEIVTNEKKIPKLNIKKK